jgi:hypothetical protein
MLQRLVGTVAVFLLIPTVGLLASATSAAAADGHWVSGTYQTFIQGSGGQTLVLLPNHTVAGGGTWSVQKNEVTVDVPGGEAPYTTCLDAGQGPICYVSDQYSGPKTPAGIASQAAPGVAYAYLGGYLLVSEPFWAVRTGNVPRGKSSAGR